jgi:hypothetical protein
MRNCWASHLSNCNGKLTREHIISNSILDQMIKVKGFSWCKDEFKKVSSASLTSRILCKKHNNELSKFDSEAKLFTSTINNLCEKDEIFKKFGFRKKELPIIYKIDGIKLERWCCKTLINIAFSQKNKITIYFDKILPIIFQDKNFKRPYGLNFAVNIGQKIDSKNFFEIVPLLNETSDNNKELAGGLFIFKGFRIIMLLPCSKEHNELQLNLDKEMKKEWTGLHLNWHNEAINYTKQEGKKEYLMQIINFKW